MKFVWAVTGMEEMRSSCKIPIRKPNGKATWETLSSRGGYQNGMGMGCEDLDWIEMISE